MIKKILGNRLKLDRYMSSLTRQNISQFETLAVKYSIS